VIQAATHVSRARGLAPDEYAIDGEQNACTSVVKCALLAVDLRRGLYTNPEPPVPEIFQ